ncbi:MATE family efflux transporter [Metabacillus idriensis]|uniref:MATE family efflux transporter n=1 Tax=Metabacillus idriensis TaxID=324768 RepID=UPI00174E1967|nr:MATE family efflux transporter [Metabacillus idriensis]
MNHKSYLMLALPLIASTITTPLIGAVDTAVVGQLPDPAYIGGVAVGAILFNTMYWLLGFLRVSTSGFTAQAHGSRDEEAIALSFIRPFITAGVMGIIFILFQQPIAHLAMAIIDPSEQVQEHAQTYITIRIWGAPFALMNYVILGWLMGLSKIKFAFYLQVGMNVLNILLDLLFVSGFSWNAAGVAAATLIAEAAAAAAGLGYILKSQRNLLRLPNLKKTADITSLMKMMTVNRDLFLRTVCLLIMFNLFTKYGASFGTDVLAANAILIQIHYIMAYFFDGFANASSILTGRAIGAKDRNGFDKILSLSYQWSLYAALLITLVYFFVKDSAIELFTQIPAVAELASHYGDWLLLYPLSACAGLVIYGIFTGATSVVHVRNSMIFSLIVYLLFLWAFLPVYGNHGLWAAFIAFSFCRSVFLMMYVPRLRKNLFSREELRRQ